MSILFFALAAVAVMSTPSAEGNVSTGKVIAVFGSWALVVMSCIAASIVAHVVGL